MKYLMTGAVLALCAGMAQAEAVKLTLADPQPQNLTPGLAVSYAYGAGGRTLAEAEKKLRNAAPGTPLVGLSYLDGDDGDKTLTSDEAYKVAAAISGYIQFEAAGTFDLQFFSNDGLQAHIGGQEVVLFDGVHACEPSKVQSVEVPTAGWYTFEATYFQRKGTACLMMDWTAEGEMLPVPDSAFGH